MPARVNINGRVVDADEARISVFDHGFLYGDAVYETLRTYGGRPFRFDPHFARLGEAATTLGLSLPWTPASMRAEVDRTLNGAPAGGEWLIRIIVTRGAGPVTPDPDSCTEPTLVILVLPLTEFPPEYYRDGVAIAISRFKRAPGIASIKTGNLIHQVLGAREAKEHGALETIFLDSEGHLSDGTRSNICLVRDGEVLTPSEECGIVAGITRALVLEIARKAGVRVVEGRFAPDLIHASQEVFLTSTTKAVLPVTRVGGEKVGTGQVGPLTRRLGEAFHSEVERFLAEEAGDRR